MTVNNTMMRGSEKTAAKQWRGATLHALLLMMLMTVVTSSVFGQELDADLRDEVEPQYFFLRRIDETPDDGQKPVLRQVRRHLKGKSGRGNSSKSTKTPSAPTTRSPSMLTSKLGKANKSIKSRKGTKAPSINTKSGKSGKAEKSNKAAKSPTAMPAPTEPPAPTAAPPPTAPTDVPATPPPTDAPDTNVPATPPPTDAPEERTDPPTESPTETANTAQASITIDIDETEARRFRHERRLQRLQRWAANEQLLEQQMLSSKDRQDRLLQRLLRLEEAEDVLSTGNSTDANSIGTNDTSLDMTEGVAEENTGPLLTVQVSFTTGNGSQQTKTAGIPFREKDTVYAYYFYGLPTEELCMVTAVGVDGEQVWERFVAGEDTRMHLSLLPIGQASPRNLDFVNGTADGWDLKGPASSFSVQTHKESIVADNVFAREANDEMDDFRLLFEEDRLLLEDNETDTYDLWLTTADSGDISASHIFTIPTDAAVAVRYRVISEAIQKGGYVTPWENNDDFRLVITSTDSTMHYIKQDSIMGLGIENFDYKTGSTEWMHGGVLYASGDVKVEVVLGTDQDGDSEFKSHLVIDMIQVLEGS